MIVDKAPLLALALAAMCLPLDSLAAPPDRESLPDFVCGALEKIYFDPVKAKALCKAARETGKSPEFVQAAPADQARQLTQALRNRSHDKHFYVGIPKPAGTVAAVPPTATATAPAPALPADANGGWVEVRILPGQIGYVKWTQHVADDAAFAKITAALQFLSGVKALVFDISRDGGGDGRANGFVYQHLFQDEAYQGLLQKKCKGETAWKNGEVPYHYSPAPKFYQTPVYILVSEKTGSAAEYFALIGQDSGRATVLGTTTAGAGNPVAQIATDDYVAYIPNCEIRTRSGRSIEGVGVVPDVVLKSDDRVQEALAFVRQDLARKSAAGAP
ncbi:S41 family peptidase [Lysobacter enzymogenes]|uniref:S41 family peptidase n=1 Tax=Lysobacter enzymogenes TaxID=69 RepID=UPI00099B3A94|nr:S41 family peptidase [Lysobacter enzymogenes]UZW59114.1 S41 family peptidase [Lysobacter enzymogenes]